jgi:uncharacterized protein YecE (DUF72 family)
MRIGTCSWKYPEWADMIYDEQTENYLEAYARRYSTVEIDQWFWSLFDGGIKLPDPAVAREYAASVPEDFRFTIKLPDSLSLTHYRDRSGSGMRINPRFLSLDFLEEVLIKLNPILDKTLVLILQFEYLNKRKMIDGSAFSAVLEDFFSALPERAHDPAGPRFGIEIRNPQYYSPEFFSLLARYSISPVLLHGYYMPPVLRTVREFARYLGEDAPAVIRLHGPDRQEMDRLSGKSWNRIIRPMDDDIPRIVETVHILEDRGIETIINVNNHYEGCAPLSIAKLLEQL